MLAPLPDRPRGWNHPIEPLPRWVEALLAPILRDFEPPQPVPLRLGWSDDGSGPFVLTGEEGHTDLTGVRIPGYRDHAERIAAIADNLQEQFFPETAAAWGEARPACPIAGHGHPLDARARDGVAEWICPGDGTAVGRIGELG